MSLHPNTAFQASPSSLSMDDLAADLNTSIDRALRLRPRARGAVIALHWANDDIGVTPLEDILLGIFTSTYGYQVTRYEIPLVESQPKLLQRLLSWHNRNRGDDMLRIVIYSGHARAAGTDATSWRLCGRTDGYGNLQGPTIDWWKFRGLFETIPGETCHIFDCCSAGSLALGYEDGDETIASCGWNQSASASNQWSFTQALIDTLQDLNGTPATLAQIFGTLFRRAQQSQVEASPIYVPNRHRPSITLAPSGTHRRLSSRETESRPISRVLISVRVRDTLLHDPASWNRWLLENIPSDVVDAEVTVEAVFRGSCVLLMSIPIEIWSMLPRGNVAYTFVAHVNSHILATQPAHRMPIRPLIPPANENIPPAWDSTSVTR